MKLLCVILRYMNIIVFPNVRTKILPFPLGYFKYDAPTTTSLRTPTGLIGFPVNEPKTDAIAKGTVAFSITIPKPPKQNL